MSQVDGEDRRRSRRSWRQRPWAGSLRRRILAGACLVTMVAGGSQAAVAQTTSLSEPVTFRGQNGVLDATGEAGDAAARPEMRAESAERPRRFGPEPFPSAAQAADAETPQAEAASSMGPLVTVTSSLAIVLGLFGGLVWLVRRSGGKATSQLPEDVFSLLGRTTVGPRQTISLARCGRRILVLAVSPGSTTTLAEITDPDEVADLVAQCGNGGSRQLFQQTLREMGERSPAAPGFVDSDAERPRNSLFVNG